LGLNKRKTGSFGDSGGEDTPGPIPNPVVKLSSADGTLLVTAWKSRSSPREPVFLFALRSTQPHHCQK
jgi:hypothetical protein